MRSMHYVSIVAAAAAIMFSQASVADSLDLHLASGGDVSASIIIGTPPPAPIVEVVPAPRPGYVWTPGYWAWEGHRHVWVQGAWIAERPGYSYAPGHWERHGDRWQFAPGRWQEHRAAEHRREERREEWRDDRHGDRHDHDYRDR